MTRLIYYIVALSLLFVKAVSAQDVQRVAAFDKVIVSSYIQVSFVEGEEESVTIESNLVEEDKLHIEVKDKTLRIYLEDARLLPMEEKLSKKGEIVDRIRYEPTTVKAIVTYKKLKEVAVRGEENFEFLSSLSGESFLLTVYGSSIVTLNQVNLNKLKATLYGESKLLLKSGSVQQQKYTSYGTNKVDALAITSVDARIIAYGDGGFKINAEEKIKITAYGSSVLKYSGAAEINKGMNFGDLRIQKI